MDKWSAITDKLGISGEKAGWMHAYAEMHQQQANYLNEFPIETGATAFAKIMFPKILNINTGLVGDHWANKAARGVKGAPAMLVSFAAAYSTIKLKNRRMQRKFAKNLRRYISAAAYDKCYAKYMASPHMRRWTQDMVPVQPMEKPSGELFFLDIKDDCQEVAHLPPIEYRRNMDEIGRNLVHVQSTPFPLVQRILRDVKGDICGIVEYEKNFRKQ